VRILFHMLPEIGHLNPTFPLARILADRGHEVLYTSIIDLQRVIEARGFACVPIHAEILPQGAFTALQENPDDQDREHGWDHARDRVCAEYYEGGRLENILRTVNPDLLIADVVPLSPLQFVAHALGIPCLQISTSLSQRHDELPPLISSLEPDTPQLLLDAARWESCSVRSFGAVPYTGIITAMIDGYCARYAYPPQDISIRSVFWPALAQFRDAALCEEAFDLPRKGPGPIHLATPVDVQRVEAVPERLASFVGDCTSLIYASLGSLPGRYPHGTRFFREFIEAMRAEPAWRAVLATGPMLDRGLLTDIPDNVLLVRNAPQIWLLRRAAVLVTHAGLGSVREAIELEVPMVAVPQQHDQPGNATRIVHHGIGLAIPSDAVTAGGLRRAISKVLAPQAGFRVRIRALAQACRAEVASGKAVASVENAAASMRARPRELSPPADNAVPAKQGWAFVGGVAGLLSLRRKSDTEYGAGLRPFEDLTAALAFGGGSLLARLEADRCQWFIQADDLLFEYAEWCAHQALEVSAIADPYTAAALREKLRETRNLRARGAGYGEKLAQSQRAFAWSAHLFHEGHGAAGEACNILSTDAAFGAQSLALHTLARSEAADLAGTKEGMDAYGRRYCLERARFGAELERRVATRTREFGIEWGSA
jgi:zeaxanthin glucosyltransferase